MKKLHWYDFITINIFWLGLNVSTGTITPVLLPYLVAMFVPDAMKNSGLATVRVIGLALAMLVQPMAGILSDRNTSPWGRRRPYIFGGVLFNLVFLLIVGISPALLGSSSDEFFLETFGFNTAFIMLMSGIVLLQISSNTTQAATQGLIPDLVPEDQRGRASGVKAVMELLPVFVVIFIGPLVDSGNIWSVIAIVGVVFLITMLFTLLFVHEEPLKERPVGSIKEPFFRLAALTGIFIGATQAAIWIVKFCGRLLTQIGTNLNTQIILVGFFGLVGMAGSIFIGVYFGAWVGIGQKAHQYKPFIWWVVNRLLFLAAVGSIQGFAQYFLRDVLNVPNAATQTTILLVAVALFLLPSAIASGYFSDRIGRKRLVAISGIVAAFGSFLLLFANDMHLVIVSGCIIGLGTGIFMSTNWALGTDLVPKNQAGKFLGISNIAGAGAGIVGAGIGGPMADFFNALQSGLGYLVIITLYGILFLFSTLSLTRVTGVR
ncbi:MFS transporter [Chloroflexota bacterium]